MSSYSATAQLSNGTLSVTRPMDAPDAVDEVIDSLIWAVRSPDSSVTSVGVTVVTTDDNLPPAPEPTPDPAAATPDPAQQSIPDTPPTDPAPDSSAAPDSAPAPDAAAPDYPGRPPAAQPLSS